jgi:acetyl esterase
MPLDPQAQKVVETIAALNLKPISQSTPDEAREAMRTRTAGLGPVEDVPAVADHRVGDRRRITVRVYSPAGTNRIRPGLYHGGGWVIGDLVTHDGICRSLANAARCAVASVDYRLAPEHRYPVAAEDSYAGFQWVLGHAAQLGSIPAVAVGGDSAGGNLAAVMALLARDRRRPRLSLQLLVYPVTNHDFGTPSYRENATGYLLTTDDMRWFWRHYLVREEQGREPNASPLLAKSLGDLPPALVITAGCDPLRDEGEAYAKRLREAGVSVTLTQYPGMFHGFVRMTRILDQSRALLDEMAGALRKALG